MGFYMSIEIVRYFFWDILMNNKSIDWREIDEVIKFIYFNILIGIKRI